MPVSPWGRPRQCWCTGSWCQRPPPRALLDTHMRSVQPTRAAVSAANTRRRQCSQHAPPSVQPAHAVSAANTRRQRNKHTPSAQQTHAVSAANTRRQRSKYTPSANNTPIQHGTWDKLQEIILWSTTTCNIVGYYDPLYGGLPSNDGLSISIADKWYIINIIWIHEIILSRIDDKQTDYKIWNYNNNNNIPWLSPSTKEGKSCQVRYTHNHKHTHLSSCTWYLPLDFQ